MEKAFLQAIVDEPNDDAPRLIFADWLEEHGDVERAEFIRIQIQLDRLPPKQRGRQALEERSAHLLCRYRERWAAALREIVPWFGTADIGFARGFPISLRIFLDDLSEHAAELFAIAPIQRIALRGPGARTFGAILVQQWRELIFSPGMKRITHLQLSLDDGCRVNDDGIIALAVSPYVCNVTMLDLTAAIFGIEGSRALYQSIRAGSLRNVTTLLIGQQTKDPTMCKEIAKEVEKHRQGEEKH